MSTLTSHPDQADARRPPGAPLTVGIVGTGNIGTDLLLKVEESEHLECVLFAGRRSDSPGLEIAAHRGVTVSTNGILAIIGDLDEIDVVFDATSARHARDHWSLLEPLGATMIDLTPARLGKFCVPALNLDECVSERYLSMVTCGGQAAVPLAHCLRQAAEDVNYIEIVSTSAAASVGPATRSNMDEYLTATERATRQFCGVAEAKTMLVVNPAEPGVTMRNTIAVPASVEVDMPRLLELVESMERTIQSYVPGYRVVVPPVQTADRLLMTVEVEGLGDWLPQYAGNLDIITCAAVAVAEARASSDHVD
jgi:acetaldehyde dehydrogenase (acetylating)